MRKAILVLLLLYIITFTFACNNDGYCDTDESFDTCEADCFFEEAFSRSTDMVDYWYWYYYTNFESVDTWVTGHTCPSTGNPVNYFKSRYAGVTLELFARYYPYAKADEKTKLEKMMLDLYTYLNGEITTGTYGYMFKSDYYACYGAGGSGGSSKLPDEFVNSEAIQGFYYYQKAIPNAHIKEQFKLLAKAYIDYVYNEVSTSYVERNINHRAPYYIVAYLLNKEDPSKVSLNYISYLKKHYDMSVNYMTWDRSQEVCGAPLGFGSWTHGQYPSSYSKKCAGCPNNCDSYFIWDYSQYSGYHNLIIEGLTSYYHLLNDRSLCSSSSFKTNGTSDCTHMKYMSLAMTSWYYQIWQDNGSVYFGYPSFPQNKIEIYPSQAIGMIFENLKVINDNGTTYFPYYPGYPNETSKTLTESKLFEKINLGIDYSNGSDYYANFHMLSQIAEYYLSRTGAIATTQNASKDYEEGKNDSARPKDILWANGKLSSCVSSSNCVDQYGTCKRHGTSDDFYGLHTGLNEGGNNNIAYCYNNGSWLDCDKYGATYCEKASVCGETDGKVPSGETTAFGEYTTFGESECCGDDTGEYYITAGNYSACCNNASDTINSSLECITEETNENPICQEHPNERYNKTQMTTEITNWKNGNHSLSEIILIAQLYKNC